MSHYIQRELANTVKGTWILPYGLISAASMPVSALIVLLTQLVSEGTGVQSCLLHAKHLFVGNEDISNGARCLFVGNWMRSDVPFVSRPPWSSALSGCRIGVGSTLSLLTPCWGEQQRECNSWRKKEDEAWLRDVQWEAGSAGYRLPGKRVLHSTAIS